MKSGKIIFTLVGVMILSLGGNKLMAQFDEMFTQYMNNEMFINPAYTGSKEALAFTVLHREQWIGFDGRPITTTFSINAPFDKDNMGLGLCYLNEKIGVLNRNIIYLSYAYRIRTGAHSSLRLGLMGGVHLQLEKVSDLVTTEQNDPGLGLNLPVEVSPNFGFGIYFNTEKFYAGFSIPRLIDDHVKFTPGGLFDRTVQFNAKGLNYYLTLGRVFNAGPDLKLKPQIMLKAVMDAPLQLDANLNALIKDKLWIGVSYRTGADISGIVGVQINPSFLISYSYDYALTKIHTFASGSHELMLSYVFYYRGKKIVSPRYF